MRPVVLLSKCSQIIAEFWIMSKPHSPEVLGNRSERFEFSPGVRHSDAVVSKKQSNAWGTVPRVPIPGECCRGRYSREVQIDKSTSY
jgi:hypothetical protein